MSHKKPSDQQAFFRKPLNHLTFMDGQNIEFSFYHYEDGTKVVAVRTADSNGGKAILTFSGVEAIQMLIDALAKAKAGIQFELQRKIESPGQQIELPDRNKRFPPPSQN